MCYQNEAQKKKNWALYTQLCIALILVLRVETESYHSEKVHKTFVEKFAQFPHKINWK